jgi:hypothetical protein
MQKIQRGSGFRGCLDYLFDHDGGRVVGGNMSGTAARALAMEFGATRRQRPDIAKPVWHNALRLPRDERVEMTDEKWTELADDYMRGMGFSDQHPRVYVRHDPDHLHILASRVGLGGDVYLGRNENLRSTSLIQRLEQVYGLTVTKGPKRTPEGRVAPPEVRKTRQGERRRYERLEAEPPRERLQRLVTEAVQGKPTASEFVARLQSRGVSVWPNVASTGRLTGFSFGIGGVAFTGQQLGDRYRWARLQKAGVHYDPARDMDALLAARPAVDPSELSAELAGAELAGIEGDAPVQPTPTALDGFRAEEGRYGVRFRGMDGKGAFFDTGRRIAVDAWQDQTAVLAAMQLASEKWGEFTVYGPPEYQALCARLAAEHGFRVKNPDLQDAIQALRPKAPVAPAPVPEVGVFPIVEEAVTVSREAEPEAPAPEVEQDDRPRPALAEGLDLTPEELETARRLEEEAREFEEIQAAMDAPDPEPGPRVRGPRM